MTYRVLFLDFDGVLNCARYLGRAPSPCFTGDDAMMLDPDKVALLDTLARDVPGFAVVVSSSWRHGHHTPVLRDFLRRRGFSGLVLDATPTLATNDRAEEIRTWLARAEDVASWAAVDDVHMPELGERFVGTSFDDGLQPHHVERLRAILVAGPA